MNTFMAVILGLIQGLTEFLPVSSSGHLSIFENLFNIDESHILLYAAILHLGTLASVFVVYRKDIAELFKELFGLFSDVAHGKGMRINSSPTRRLGAMIVVSAIPTGFVGYTFSSFFEGLYAKAIVIGICLIITGTILFLAERVKGKNKGIYKMRFRDAFFVGLCQSVAIFPGISRSGSTLVGSLVCGLNRPLALKYAFLMSIPPIGASGIMELIGALGQGTGDISILSIIIGVAVAFVAGLAAIKLMIKIVTDKSLIGFSIYTWIAGAAVILLFVLGIL